MDQKKLDFSKYLLYKIAEEYKNPIIYSGMGKDSICVIHLCRSLGLKWDIMFHRDPYFPIKYRYANSIIEKWNLVCRDYPARMCSVFNLNNTFEVVRHFQVGTLDMVLCAMLYEPEEFIEGEYLCALKQVYEQPKGTAQFFWDIGIQGHKAAECKPHSGMQPNLLQWPLKHMVNNPDWAQPLWQWTEEDIYCYIKENDIPINTNVYEEKDGRLVPVEDSTYNPDRRPACYHCMDKRNDAVVMCPRMGVPVNNISGTLVQVDMPNDFPRYQKEKEK